VRRLVAGLRAKSDLFAELWESGAVGDMPVASRKIIDHPQVAPLTLDCDVLDVAGADLRSMLYTAEPDTEDAGSDCPPHRPRYPDGRRMTTMANSEPLVRMHPGCSAA
jgi:hypothetical protein